MHLTIFQSSPDVETTYTGVSDALHFQLLPDVETTYTGVSDTLHFQLLPDVETTYTGVSMIPNIVKPITIFLIYSYNYIMKKKID